MPIDDWDVVVVTYNSADALELAWADASESLRARVVCVDNSSADATVEIARRLFPTVLSSPNLGLSVANNLGARQGTSRYVLYCNPDAVIIEKDLIELEHHLEEHPGLVAPRLVSADGSEQESARGLPSLPRQVWNRLTARSSARSEYRWPVESGIDSPVPWILGAIVASRRSDIDALGGWPEDFFLYFEDTELSLRAWDRGFEVWILGTMRWTHFWNRESRSLLSKAARLHMRSAVHFYANRPRLLIGAPFRVPPRSKTDDA